MEKGSNPGGAVLVSLLVAVSMVAAGCTVSVGLKKKEAAFAGAGQGPERTPVYQHDGWIIARGSIHNHTTYSDGCRSPEDLLEMARAQGMAVLAYTDHREGKICAGKGRRLCARTGGVEDYGYRDYYDHIGRIQKEAAGRGIIVLKGVEVIPWFYNYGKGVHLVLDGLQHHFTVYGVEDAGLFEDMPARDMIPLKPEPVPDETPWKEWAEWLDRRGAIVHAVHVEEGADMWYGPAHGYCPPPIHNIHAITAITDFAVLPYAAGEKAGGPGGLWDTTLIEYLYGMRQRPVWAAADADYHCEGSLAIATTMFYMKEFTEDEVYRCMREGRMVALQGDAFQDSYVADWSVSDGGRPQHRVMSGMEVELDSPPLVRFSLNRPVPDCVTRLVRNGVVVKEVEGTDLEFRDRELGAKREPAYYRVEVTGPRADRGEYEGPTVPRSELRTNPIFVRWKQAPKGHEKG